jgi:hypothetical protein
MTDYEPGYGSLRQIIQTTRTRAALDTLEECIQQLPPDADALLLRQLCRQRRRALPMARAAPVTGTGTAESAGPGGAVGCPGERPPKLSRRWWGGGIRQWVQRVLPGRTLRQAAKGQDRTDVAA